MASFKFKLGSLLKYRGHQRDLCRQLLAQVLEDDAQCVRQQDEMRLQQEFLAQEMREISNEGGFNVNEIATRRFHIGQLKLQILELDQKRQQIAQQIQLCRNALIQADQAVKALDNLKEKQRLQHAFEERKKADRFVEEAWQAANYGRTGS